LSKYTFTKTHLLRKLKVLVKRIQATIIAGLLLLILILPQLALAAGPVISSVSYTVNEPTAANITWTTNNSSDSRVNYGTDPTSGGVVNIVYNSSYVNSHFIRLEGLLPDTTYYFEVQSTNPSGTSVDNNGGEYYSFRTSPPPVGYYLITLNPVCGVCSEIVEAGVCDEIIEATAIVSAPGTNTYHICWDARTEAGVVETFTTTGAGANIVTFFMPETTKGIHTVYLTDITYAEKAQATFEVRPSVKIAPEEQEGPVDTAVTLNGYGFDASQDIQVKFKDTVITTTKANTAGSWNATYTILDTPGGDYVFKVEAKEGTGLWVNWVSKDFEVIPKITVTPSSGTVGQTIEVSGTGFADEEEDVEVTFDTEVVKPNTPIVVGQDGSWEATIVIPPLHRGDHYIDASGESTRARDVTDVKFVVGAGILVELVESLGPYVGDTINVKGGGFATSETGIRVYFDGAPVTQTFNAKGDGTWETSFILPASSYGSHTIGASGAITTAATTTLSTKAKIESISPVEGSPGDSVTLTGSGFSSSNELTVTVGGVAAAEHAQTQANGNVVINFHVPKESPEGKQLVTAADQGGAAATAPVDFTVTNKILSTTPLPISPKNNTLRSGEVTFHWQGVTGDTGYTYTLEINTSASPGNIWSKPGNVGSTYTLAEEEALPRDTYYWRIKIVDDYGNESPWSDYSEFTVAPISIPTWVWVIVGVVVFVVLMVVAYRETKFKVTE
jgi:hypothetical protein